MTVQESYMSKLYRLFPTAFTITMLFFDGFAFAQSTGSIGGTVTDAAGAVIPNAVVTVQSQGTGETHATRTDASGIYLVPSLPVGTYRIEVKSPGMQTTFASGVELSVGSALRQDLSLRVGSAAETVEVSGAAPLVDSSTASLGSVVDHRTVQEIPLNGHHFIDLSLRRRYAGKAPSPSTPPADARIASTI
jgi:Carboxypeptidase regulatory-like domain